MYVISHIFSEKLEVRGSWAGGLKGRWARLTAGWLPLQIAYREAEALKKQDLLIAEEVELQKLEEASKQAKAMAEKEKKAKKKVRAW